MKIPPCSCIGRINIVKLAILPKAVYRFNAIPFKIPMLFFTEMKTINLKFHMETQKIPNSKINSEQKDNACVPQHWVSNLYYRVTKTWYWHKHRNKD
jgi:hypothetical protein